jgi:hypothetical protein
MRLLSLAAGGGNGGAAKPGMPRSILVDSSSAADGIESSDIKSAACGKRSADIRQRWQRSLAEGHCNS